jgi:NADPH:quinone reductase
LSFLKGNYPGKTVYPITPGIEGSGVVVASGSGLLAYARLGKTVACTSAQSGGSWAQYMLTSSIKVLPLSSNINIEQGAMLIVNPMTALAFIKVAKEGNHKAIVNTAAASVLGRMLIDLCKANNIPLINIVRRTEQVDILKNAGAEHVISTADMEWEKQLEDLSYKLNATLFLDAIAGANTAKLARLAPKGSCIVIYANLSEANIEFDPRILMHSDLTVQNFYLGNWASKQSIFYTLNTANKARKLLANISETIIRKRYTLHMVNEAIAEYQQQMTGGKMLITM